MRKQIPKSDDFPNNSFILFKTFLFRPEAPARRDRPLHRQLHRAVVVMATACLLGCVAKLPPVQVPTPTSTISYLKEIKPLLDRRCVVCHSCYNAPCQLKLEAYEGVDRGGSKQAVYDGARLHSMNPTRLFTDAHSTSEWRKKEFFSVTQGAPQDGPTDSIMAQLLAHKMRTPRSEGEYSPETDTLTCSRDVREAASYLDKHPNRGMPYGFPPLQQGEFELVAGWLAQGARGPSIEQQQELTTPKPADAAAIARWEAFLNQDDAKHAMTARYLYEHLFLAHLTFGTRTGEYYEIVRSKTGPGKSIELIPTVRPYDDPGVAQVSYRLRKIHSTIVAKTHMVFEFDDAQLARFKALFIEPDWQQTPHLVGYDPKLSANPFVAFEQIPARARYQFLLDNSLYTLKTFIQGPVCKGQIALNVIEDHFWVVFFDPNHELSVKYPGFLKVHAEQLRMPIEKGSNYGVFSALNDEHHAAAVAYYRARQDFYATHNSGGLDYDAIWRGSRSSDAPLLTIYRHFDSASVHKGALGELPKTLWVIDYPQLERIYYSLVAGFDVYGTLGHQLSLRLYMDRLRVEGESSFLDFMPVEQRRALMQSWYLGVDLEKMNYNQSGLPTKIAFATNEPKREFIEHLVNTHFLPGTQIGLDPTNYLPVGTARQRQPEKYETREDVLRGFSSVAGPGTPFFALLNEHNANLAYVRIRMKTGKDLAGTIVLNRWHDNVAFMFGEGGRYNPAKDSADFISGLIGAYPNYFIDVRQEELPEFFALLTTFTKSPRDLERLAKFGVNRADDRFWAVSDWFQQRSAEEEPVEGGLFDLNRYYSTAR